MKRLRTTPPTQATPLGGDQGRVQWDYGLRADYYQFWIQVAGVDVDFRCAGSPDCPEKMFESQPAGATVKIKMRAVNEENPDAFGDEVTVAVS